jgi:undecaprenyl-diphosphatase
METWVPLYFFLILFVVINFKKTGGWWVLFATITVICTDFISSNLIKGNIYRLRPCNDPANAEWFRMVHGISFPQSSSFTSSHATNHFGLAVFFFITLHHVLGKWASLFFVWAACVCYAQMYIGVHYPIDIICGGLVGSTIGYFTASIFQKRFKKLEA